VGSVAFLNLASVSGECPSQALGFHAVVAERTSSMNIDNPAPSLQDLRWRDML